MSGDKFKIKLGDKTIGEAVEFPMQENEYVLEYYKRIKNRYFFRSFFYKMIITCDTPLYLKQGTNVVISADAL